MNEHPAAICLHFITHVLSLLAQIPPGIQADQKIRMSGKGIPRVSSYGYGDHYVHIKIKVPK